MEGGTVLPVAAATVAVPGNHGKKFKFTWEHGVMIALCGAALISGGLLMVQWKPAMMGRRVKKDLVTFLKAHGAQVEGDKISGGPVTIPMTVDEAVVGTIDTIITDINNRTKKTQQPPRHNNRTPEVVAAAADAAAQGAQGATPRSGRPQGRSPADQMMMPAGAQAPQGGKPEFPEAPLSGRTGKPVTQQQQPEQQMQLPQTIGGFTHDSQGDVPSSGDFSYIPPMPPGMRPPVGAA